jgi:hypothetical protein
MLSLRPELLKAPNEHSWAADKRRLKATSFVGGQMAFFCSRFPKPMDELRNAANLEPRRRSAT